jgi:hemoglobin
VIGPGGYAEKHAARADELAEQALRPGLRLRRARLFAAVAQVHATLAAAAQPPAPTAAAPSPPAPVVASVQGASPQAGDARAHEVWAPGARTSAAPGPQARVAPLPVAGTVSPTVSRPTGGPTLFERLRGEDGISHVVQAFYVRVLGDPQLSHYFESVPMWRMQRHMVAFLVQATGGPARYDGRDMSVAHAGLDITSRDFDRVARHLVETLVGSGVAAADVDEVLSTIGPLKQHVVSVTPGSADGAG